MLMVYESRLKTSKRSIRPRQRNVANHWVFVAHTFWAKMAAAIAVILAHNDNFSHEDAAAPMDVLLLYTPVESKIDPVEELPLTYSAVDEVTFKY